MTIETARRASLEFVCVFGQDELARAQRRDARAEHPRSGRQYSIRINAHGRIYFRW